MAYQRRPVAVEVVQWTGDALCLAGTPFSAYFTVDRCDGALPVGPRLCRVGEWLVSDGRTLEIVPNASFAAEYEEV